LSNSLTNLPRLGIGNFPTPFEELTRFEKVFENGPRIFVKRDDLTGLAMGGNKVRQLDYVLVKAKEEGVDTIITTCGIQSNWSRQTVAAAVKLGMKAVLVLRTAQFNEPPEVYDGNILLDYIMGADIEIVKMKISGNPREFLEAQAERLRREGHKPLIIDLADATSAQAVGAYADCMKETVDQARSSGVSLDAVVVASSAGATQAGLILGSKMLEREIEKKVRIIGVNVGAYNRDFLIKTIINSAESAAKLCRSDIRLTTEDITLLEDFAGEDYGIPTSGSLEAIRLLARTEALILDPVYTSKAMDGFISLVRGGQFKRGSNVCFLHTGGVPALFAYKQNFQPPKK
jgi:L-cysteate sulfo-lyase